MRIISGVYKGCIVKSPKGIRPTQDNVRKALFDILGDMEGLSFLELFAGSGAVGLQALSNGAKNAVVVEKDRQAAGLIRENVKNLGVAEGKITIVQRDVFEAIPAFFNEGKRFDIVFLDPPYYRELARKALQMLGHYDIVTDHGYCVVQHFKKDTLAQAFGPLQQVKQASYGDSLLTLYAKESHLSR